MNLVKVLESAAKDSLNRIAIIDWSSNYFYNGIINRTVEDIIKLDKYEGHGLI